MCLSVCVEKSEDLRRHNFYVFVQWQQIVCEPAIFLWLDDFSCEGENARQTFERKIQYVLVMSSVYYDVQSEIFWHSEIGAVRM